MRGISHLPAARYDTENFCSHAAHINSVGDATLDLVVILSSYSCNISSTDDSSDSESPASKSVRVNGSPARCSAALMVGEARAIPCQVRHCSVVMLWL